MGGGPAPPPPPMGGAPAPPSGAPPLPVQPSHPIERKPNAKDVRSGLPKLSYTNKTVSCEAKLHRRAVLWQDTLENALDDADNPVIIDTSKDAKWKDIVNSWYDAANTVQKKPTSSSSSTAPKKAATNKLENELKVAWPSSQKVFSNLDIEWKKGTQMVFVGEDAIMPLPSDIIDVVSAQKFVKEYVTRFMEDFTSTSTAAQSTAMVLTSEAARWASVLLQDGVEGKETLDSILTVYKKAVINRTEYTFSTIDPKFKFLVILSMTPQSLYEMSTINAIANQYTKITDVYNKFLKLSDARMHFAKDKNFTALMYILREIVSYYFRGDSHAYRIIYMSIPQVVGIVGGANPILSGGVGTDVITNVSLYVILAMVCTDNLSWLIDTANESRHIADDVKRENVADLTKQFTELETEFPKLEKLYSSRLKMVDYWRDLDNETGFFKSIKERVAYIKAHQNIALMFASDIEAMYGFNIVQEAGQPYNVYGSFSEVCKLITDAAFDWQSDTRIQRYRFPEKYKKESEKSVTTSEETSLTYTVPEDTTVSLKERRFAAAENDERIALSSEIADAKKRAVDKMLLDRRTPNMMGRLRLINFSIMAYMRKLKSFREQLDSMKGELNPGSEDYKSLVEVENVLTSMDDSTAEVFLVEDISALLEDYDGLEKKCRHAVSSISIEQFRQELDRLKSRGDDIFKDFNLDKSESTLEEEGDDFKDTDQLQSLVQGAFNKVGKERALIQSILEDTEKTPYNVDVKQLSGMISPDLSKILGVRQVQVANELERMKAADKALGQSSSTSSSSSSSPVFKSSLDKDDFFMRLHLVAKNIRRRNMPLSAPPSIPRADTPDDSYFEADVVNDSMKRVGHLLHRRIVDSLNSAGRLQNVIGDSLDVGPMPSALDAILTDMRQQRGA